MNNKTTPIFKIQDKRGNTVYCAIDEQDAQRLINIEPEFYMYGEEQLTFTFDDIENKLRELVGEVYDFNTFDRIATKKLRDLGTDIKCDYSDIDKRYRIIYCGVVIAFLTINKKSSKEPTKDAKISRKIWLIKNIFFDKFCDTTIEDFIDSKAKCFIAVYETRLGLRKKAIDIVKSLDCDRTTFMALAAYIHNNTKTLEQYLGKGAETKRD